MNLDIEELKKAKFRGPVTFGDGANGMAFQAFECVDNTRFGYTWRRENRNDPGRQFYTVDGSEVKDLAEAIDLLQRDPDPESPSMRLKKHLEEFSESPKLNYGATRALSEAHCNAAAGHFGMVRAAMHRSASAWHGGINKHAEALRSEGKEFPFWMYRSKDAAHECSRGNMLFLHDLDKDTNMHCALGVKCRDCGILKTITGQMEAANVPDAKWPQEITPEDIAHAKVWTCLSHILQTNPNKVIDGAFFYLKSQELQI